MLGVVRLRHGTYGRWALLYIERDVMAVKYFCDKCGQESDMYTSKQLSVEGGVGHTKPSVTLANRSHQTLSLGDGVVLKFRTPLNSAMSDFGATFFSGSATINQW